jgi:hypothetical protein
MTRYLPAFRNSRESRVGIEHGNCVRRTALVRLILATIRFVCASFGSGHWVRTAVTSALGHLQTSDDPEGMSAPLPKDGVIGRPSLWIAEDFRCCASG